MQPAFCLVDDSVHFGASLVDTAIYTLKDEFSVASFDAITFNLLFMTRKRKSVTSARHNIIKGNSDNYSPGGIVSLPADKRGSSLHANGLWRLVVAGSTETTRFRLESTEQLLLDKPVTAKCLSIIICCRIGQSFKELTHQMAKVGALFKDEVDSNSVHR